jgi:hypothetical protein
MIVGVAFSTFTGVLGGDTTRYSAGERFGFRLNDAVNVSPAAVEEKMRLLNAAVPAASALEFVPLEDRAPSKSVMLTMLVAGTNTVPLSVRVNAGAGVSATPVRTLAGGSVVKASA